MEKPAAASLTARYGLQGEISGKSKVYRSNPTGVFDLKSSIEINQEAQLSPIHQVASKLGLGEDDVDFSGKYVSKVRLEVLDKFQDRPDGKLVLVTAMTPTKYGEGKTLTTIGIGQALQRLGKKGIITLREPSVGPVFGVKGGGTGGGYAQVAPMEKINLHFTGDLHAISTAHNLLAALIDNHIYQGNKRNIDLRHILWPRTVDINDRTLRQMVIGLGKPTNGFPRESGFVLTSASEVMAILALATSRADLKQRLAKMTVAFDRDGKLVHAGDLDAHKSLAVVLKEAIQPNLAQTLEHSPAFIHAGPFANIAHGSCSVLSNRVALKLADYVITEAGFASDLGAEKFFDLVCRSAGYWPSAVVIVATCRAIKHHGGTADADLTKESPECLRRGLANLEAHIRNVQQFGVPAIVAVNRFPFDSDAEVQAVVDHCNSIGAACAPHEAFMKGGEGALDLAQQVVEVADSGQAGGSRFIYELEDPIPEKLQKLARRVYGADGVIIEGVAKKQIDRFVKMGYGNLPLCMAKTQSSLSDVPSRRGVPKGWNLRVTEVRLSAGAGFLVIIAGNMMLMPGLPKVPAAMRMDIDDEGNIAGLS